MKDNKYSEYSDKLQKAINDNTQLQIRRGVIYSNLSIKTDMLKIRILPEMTKCSEDELPNYACYNPTMCIKGVAEKDTRDINKATQVWVICTSDFLVGWVLGEANQQYSVDDTKVEDPWGFSTFKSHILRCHLNTDSAVYTELKVLFSNARFVDIYNDTGIGKSKPATAVGLDVVNVRTGERFMMLQSGTTFALTQDTLYMRVGSPDQDSSFIKMTAGAIEITSNQVAIYGRNATSIGKHNMHVVGAVGMPVAIDGDPLIPLLDITC